VDADVWGFSIPRMLGVDQPPVVIDEMLVPPESHGVRCISMGFFADEDQPVIWRGPMLHKALEQFLTDVYWDEPEYLLVDLPPGTGDISISLAGFLPTAEMYIVTTPQPVAQKVAQRAAYMAEKVRITVKGVIENMSW
ncbi:MAG TPA: sodium:proton antiporter, partial [Acidimicrobiaceae bacterium]|nr:sodium:proton antiporter [Acidimicrobiaceae bacterium]